MLIFGVRRLLSLKNCQIHLQNDCSGQKAPKLPDASFPSKETLGPRNGFLPFFQKIKAFLKKLLNNKIFSSSFVIKKMLCYFLVQDVSFP